jgi:hypothetical protein
MCYKDGVKNTAVLASGSTRRKFQFSASKFLRFVLDLSRFIRLERTIYSVFNLLQGMLFLQSKQIPYQQLHAGNVLLVDGVCKFVLKYLYIPSSEFAHIPTQPRPLLPSQNHWLRELSLRVQVSCVSHNQVREASGNRCDDSIAVNFCPLLNRSLLKDRPDAMDSISFGNRILLESIIDRQAH